MKMIRQFSAEGQKSVRRTPQTSSVSLAKFLFLQNFFEAQQSFFHLKWSTKGPKVPSVRTTQ
jgi:hypothetical protein